MSKALNVDEVYSKRIREMWDKYKDNEDVLFVLSRLTSLETKLIAADIMAMMIDIAIQRDRLDARSYIGDARLNYGMPWEYEFANKKLLLGYRGGIEEVVEVLSKKKDT